MDLDISGVSPLSVVFVGNLLAVGEGKPKTDFRRRRRGESSIPERKMRGMKRHAWVI